MHYKLNFLFLVAALSLVACDSDDAAEEPQNGDFPTETLTASPVTIRVSDLPAPFASQSVTNYPQLLQERPENARLKVPQGYAVNIFADDLPQGRWMAVAPNGDVFVAQMMLNQIMVLRDTNGDGRADERTVWATGGPLSRPMGMAFNGNYFYVATSGALLRYDYTSGQKQATGQPRQLAELPGGGQHPARSLLLYNNKLYVGIGSSENASVEQDPRRTTIQEFDLEGGNRVTYASGLRNPQGMDVNPARAGEIWAVVNERDALGDDLVPDYATAVPRGAFFGYPWAYLAPDKRDPRITAPAPPEVANTRTPEVLLRAHSAALGLAFYTGTAFPVDARGDLFLAMRGSWNRSVGSGYKVVRVRMNSAGLPETAGPDGRGASFEDFVTGWQLNEGQAAPPQVWGRPVGIITGPDGSLLIAEDGNGIVWRVSYRGAN
ncbi:PQQ-dependent sugar dehydrogenase [Hymenobacter metallicola]|uniref:Sorbosone dehydrogenase family protein n=1 Tax=Hymenobacter metallicola TaxID=2563114 RepID=A0A4Z0QCN3_9BACT|nr:PQQ-dependent sugar dehydrogenase [Hymenobacter metallicola]TGE27454.1 sorbosone dehydrogenase family protein [Hymenobacter metallicola]